VAWSPDGSRLASAAGDKTVRLWDARTGEVGRTLEGHTGPVVSVAWSPDGTHLASAAGFPLGYFAVMGRSQGEAKVWDVRTGQEALTFKGHVGARSLAWPGARTAAGWPAPPRT
jgi:WD40 repeat protein